MPSKKARFDIFKRDGFQCQYCGRTPPAITLEVDHINPKSNAGVETVDNYITACFDCNRGKGKTLLSELPASMKDNLERLKERREQLKAYNKYLELEEACFAKDTEHINELFREAFPTMQLSPSFCSTSVRKFLQLLPHSYVERAMVSACAKMDTSQDATQYFCGICWNWIKRPETRDW